MTNEEKTIAMLEIVHHENCYIFGECKFQCV